MSWCALALILSGGAAGAALLSYCVCLVADMLRAARELSSAPWGKRRGAAARALTTPGRRLFDRCAQVRTQLASMSWELQAEGLRALRIPEIEGWKIGEQAEPLQSAAELLEAVHSFIEREFRSSEQATLFAAADSEFVMAGGPLPARLHAQVLALVQEASRVGVSGRVLVRQCGEGAGLSDVFSAFGISQSLVCGFATAGAAPLRGGFWLGYGAERRASELEVRALRELARKVELWLTARADTRALSEEVRRAHRESSQKSDFIAHMSHDIRSPLNNIKAILTLLRLESATAEWSELSEAGMRSCDALAEMVEDLLDYSRHRAGRLEARRETVNIGTCAEDVLAGFTAVAKLKGVVLEFENHAAGACAELDKRQLRRMLGNLVNNALKYTKSGRVSVELSRVGTGQIALRVCDTGVGMTSAQIEALFTPFSRFQPGVEGVGLGLVVTKILAELNGGKVEARSEEGRGSEFSLLFPVVEQACAA